MHNQKEERKQGSKEGRRKKGEGRTNCIIPHKEDSDNNEDYNNEDSDKRKEVQKKREERKGRRKNWES